MNMDNEKQNATCAEDEAALSCAEEILNEYLDDFLELGK